MTRNIELRISQTLSASEWATLAAFCSKTQRLIQTKIIAADESDIRGRIRYTEEQGMWFEAQVPPEEQIAEFLMVFRFFYLEKEPTNFHKVLGILGKNTKEPDAREALKVLKLKWTNALFQTVMNLSLNGEPITASMLLDVWFNAHYFHSDECKSEKLARLNSAFTESFSKYMLLDSTYNATKAIFIVYNGVKDIVDAHAKSSS